MAPKLQTDLRPGLTNAQGLHVPRALEGYQPGLLDDPIAPIIPHHAAAPAHSPYQKLKNRKHKNQEAQSQPQVRNDKGHRQRKKVRTLFRDFS